MIIGFVVIMILFLIISILNFRSNRLDRELEIGQKEGVEEIKKNWKLLKINTSDIQIIKFDTLTPEKPNSERYKHIKVIKKRTRLVFEATLTNGQKQKFVKDVLLDHTLCKFKVRMRDYIDVYIFSDEEPEVYFVDIEFLEE